MYCVLYCGSEKDILHEEINSLEVVKDKLKARVAELEEQLSKTRASRSNKTDDSDTAAKAEVRTL